MRTKQTPAHGRRQKNPARQSVLLPIRLTGARLIFYHSNTHDSAQAQSVRQNFRYGFDMILLAKGFPCAYTFWRTCANKVLCAVGRIVERKCRHRAADLCRKYCLLLKKWNIWHEKRNTYMIFAYITHFYRRWPKEELAREYKKNSTAEHAASIARAVIFFNNNQTRYALKRRGARGVALRWHVSTPECTAVRRGKTAACGAKAK